MVYLVKIPQNGFIANENTDHTKSEALELSENHGFLKILKFY
jgi:hypothetical protein